MTLVKAKAKVEYADKNMIKVKGVKGSYLELTYEARYSDMSKFHNGKVMVTIELLED